MARSPGDHMVGAGRVATDAEPADFLPALVVQGQAAAEHIDSADWSSDHRIVDGAEGGVNVLVGSRAVRIVISIERIDRIAELKAEQTAAVPISGIEIAA